MKKVNREGGARVPRAPCIRQCFDGHIFVTFVIKDDKILHLKILTNHILITV